MADKPFLYVFSKPEVARMRQVAIKRVKEDNARSRTVNRLKKGTKEEKARQYVLNWTRGIAGEVAFARLFKLPPEVEEAIMSDEYSQGAENYDIELPRLGQTVEVKTSEYAKAHLLVPKDNSAKRKGQGAERLKADYYLLTHARGDNSIRLVGYQTQAYFRENYAVKDFGIGPAYTLAYEELIRTQELWDAEHATTAIETGTKCDFCLKPPPGLVRMEPSGWACLTCYVNQQAQRMQM